MISSKKRLPMLIIIPNIQNTTQHLQRLMIEKYCKQKKLKINTEILDNNMDIPLLCHLINKKHFRNNNFSIQSINTNKKFIINLLKILKK